MATKKTTPPPSIEVAPAAPSTEAWLRNESPLGALDVPLLRRVVGRGEVVKVSRVHADILTAQDIWVEVPEPPTPDADGE